MKVAFFASDKIALPSIEMLGKRGVLACVVSNPDKPKGRGNKLSPNDVSAYALARNITLFRPEKNTESLLIEELKKLGVNSIVVMAYGSILKDAIINYPELLCLNLHGSILPEFRGASPIESALALRRKTTGVSLMRIVKKMDAGAVADTVLVEMAANDTAKTLREKMGIAAAELLEKNLTAIEQKSLVFAEQDESKATYTRKFFKDDLYIDFSLTAAEICARIRAFGCGIFEYNGIMLKILKADFCEGSPKHMGEIFVDGNNSLKISAKDSYLVVQTIQKPCAKAMDISQFLQGFKFDGNLQIAFKHNSPLLKQV